MLPESVVSSFAEADTLPEVPQVVDVRSSVPPNPPAKVQMTFVGSSYHDAYADAHSFVTVADQWSTENGLGALSTLTSVLDFGAGWGRILRMLLAVGVAPQHLVAADIDPEMMALVNVTLPGVAALTVESEPPTLLRDESVDLTTAFSVFSHLSAASHRSWAAELGRLTRDGGLAVITVLDERFFDQIQWSIDAVQSGAPSDRSLAEHFPDVEAARATYAADELVYAAMGDDGARKADNYGWAAAPKSYVQRVWEAEGFDIIHWVPSEVLTFQAVVALRRRARASDEPPPEPPPTPTWGRAARATVAALRKTLRRT